MFSLVVKCKSSGEQPTKNNTILKGDLNTMKNANFTYKLERRGYGTDVYTVENIDGMTEEEIIDACDSANFGGRVFGRTVEVYTD